MRIVTSIIKWAVSAFLCLMGLVLFTTSFISAFAFVAGALIINPIFQSFLRNKGIRLKGFIYVLASIFLFFVGIVTFPTQNTESTVTESISAENIENATSSSEKIDIIEEQTEIVYKTDENVISEPKKQEVEEMTSSSSETKKDITDKIQQPDDSGSKEINPDIAVPSIEENNEDNKTINPDSTFEVHYIDVGQGDCSLVICDNEAMLIDAGGNDKGTEVQLYLKKLGIDTLKYVVASHPDADHIGGLDVIIYKFACENILMSNSTNDTKTYEEVISSIKSKNYTSTIVDAGEVYELGSAKIEILSPFKAHPYNDTNNDSIIMRVTYGNTSFLFTGDALVQPQQVIIYDDDLDASADVVKIPHHGADSAYMKGFYDEIIPKYAVISVGSDNKYGHPHQNILNDLKSRGVKLYRTDEQGTIIAKSDGQNITFNCTPSETWAAGIEQESVGNNFSVGNSSDEKYNTVNNISSDPVVAPEAGITYVYNKNTGKFHIPTCSSVSDMKMKNREDLTCTREELLVLHPGASPCKRCHP